MYGPSFRFLQFLVLNGPPKNVLVPKQINVGKLSPFHFCLPVFLGRHLSSMSLFLSFIFIWPDLSQFMTVLGREKN